MSPINKIIVSSENQVKIKAVEEVLESYEKFKNLPVIPCSVETDISEQPLSLEETVTGAKQRAERAYRESSLSIGLESGLMAIPVSDDDYMDVCICSIYDGMRHHVGMSCGFRIPKQVIDVIFEEGLDLNQAMNQCKLTTHPKLGSSDGSIGLFTDGRLTRKGYTKQCITTAMISIDQAHYFIPTEHQNLAFSL